MENKEVYVKTKEWSNPSVAGFAALAVACFCFFALLTGRVAASAMPLIGCWLIGGFVIQFVVALLDLKGGNHAGGNAFLFFSCFFMLASGLAMFFKYNAILSGAPLDTTIDGYAWCALTLTVWLWTPAFFTKFTLLSVIVLMLDVALPFIALVDLGVLDKSLSVVPAYALLFAGCVAIYLCAAIIVNTAYGKKVYPMP